jgi:predicted metallo-beta-lactamase superfamily hydrolase
MKVVPLAAESLGVRSMATYVECGGMRLLLDPGATLAPSRQNLPPAAEEWEALRRANDRISAYGARADVVFVSHYHEDHFRSDPAAYAGRIVVAKDPRRMIAGRQARRAAALWSVLGPVARLESGDSWRRAEPDVVLRVSAPLPHGIEGTALGSVLALTVEDPRERERFVFASDVQGPLSPVATAYLLRERPTLLYLSGPPSYIEGELGAALIDRGIDNLLRVLDGTGCRAIMDHHALRDARAPARFARLWETGRVMTAAAYLGLGDAALEARRAQLWAGVRKPPARAAASTRAATEGAGPGRGAAGRRRGTAGGPVDGRAGRAGGRRLGGAAGPAC